MGDMHARRDEELVLVCGDMLTCVWTVCDHEICGHWRCVVCVTLRGVRASPPQDRRDYISAPQPEWRNGRRNGLKIRRGQPHESSTLSSGICNHVVPLPGVDPTGGRTRAVPPR